MVLATADAAGRPSARTVLLKGYDERGLRLLHQLRVAQGRRAARQPVRQPALPVVSACSGRWSSAARSRRWTGRRPRRTSPAGRAARRLGAWASPQSQVLSDRAELDERYAGAERAVRRRQCRDAAAAALGRAAGGAGDGGVLAGRGRPAARRLRLPSRPTRGVDRRAARAVTGVEDPVARSAPLGDRRTPARRVPGVPPAVVGNAVSIFGFQFTAVAVPVEMYALTRDSFWVGLLGVAALVPLLVFGLWGGAVADACDRRTAAARRLIVAVAWPRSGCCVQALLGRGTARCCCWR